MANLNDSGDVFPDVYQLEQSDPLLAGEPNEATGAGIDNIPHLQLARRTRWLKTRVDQLLTLVVAGTTSVAGILRLNDSLTSDSVSEAATPNAIRRVQLNANSRVPAARRIAGGDLATGGGTLDQDRTITVPRASDQQGIDGASNDVALTPRTGRLLVEDRLSQYSPPVGSLTTPGILRLSNVANSNSITDAATADVVRRVNENANSRVPDGRTIATQGLATGGGSLAQNRVINVPKASVEQAREATDDSVALTPLTGGALVDERLAQLVISKLVPPGALADFAMQDAPDGWLVCDGSAVGRAQYPDLFAAIGVAWGAGNGSTTFNLPDLRGEFRRGWDRGRGVDVGRSFGSSQGDQIKSHAHTGSVTEAGDHNHPLDFAQNAFSGGAVQSTIASNGTGTGQTGDAGAHTHALTINPFGGAETRPRNIAVLTCIKI